MSLKEIDRRVIITLELEKAAKTWGQMWQALPGDKPCQGTGSWQGSKNQPLQWQK